MENSLRRFTYICAGRYTTSSRNSVDNGGDVSDCYDVPPRAIPVIPSPASSPSPAPSCYDIPRPPTSCTPISNCSGGSGVTPLDCYDVPRPLQPLTPSSSASSLTNDGSLSGSNRYENCVHFVGISNGDKTFDGGDLTSVCDDPVCGRVVCNVVSITESFSRDIFLASLRRRPIDYSFPSVRSNKTHRDRLYRPWITIRCKFIKNVYAADIVCAFANTCNKCKQNIFTNYYRKRRERKREELFIVERKYDFRQRYETTK